MHGQMLAEACKVLLHVQASALIYTHGRAADVPLANPVRPEREQP